jgi:hypothetical protein
MWILPPSIKTFLILSKAKRGRAREVIEGHGNSFGIKNENESNTNDQIFYRLMKSRV